MTLPTLKQINDRLLKENLDLRCELADESARVEEFRSAMAETSAQRDAVHDRIAELKVDPEEGSGDE